MKNQSKKKLYDIIFLILTLIAVVVLFPASIIIANSGNYALGTLMAYIALIILIAVMAYTKYGEYVENLLSEGLEYFFKLCDGVVNFLGKFKDGADDENKDKKA